MKKKSIIISPTMRGGSSADTIGNVDEGQGESIDPVVFQKGTVEGGKDLRKPSKNQILSTDDKQPMKQDPKEDPEATNFDSNTNIAPKKEDNIDAKIEKDDEGPNKTTSIKIFEPLKEDEILIKE